MLQLKCLFDFYNLILKNRKIASDQVNKYLFSLYRMLLQLLLHLSSSKLDRSFIRYI